MTPIDAVLFDYGLVLTGPPQPAAWQQMKTLLGAGEDAFHAAYWNPRHDYDRGVLDSTAYWNAVAAALGCTLSPDMLSTLRQADVALWTVPNQPMIDWARSLQRAGIRTGILSNLGDAMETGVRSRFPWLEHFHHHTFSHRLHVAKPEPAIYRHAAEGLGVAPERILFLDDREENIAAARQAGMHAIQYRNHDDFLHEMKLRGFDWLLTPSVPQTVSSSG